MSVYVNIYFGQLSAISDQKFITKKGKLGRCPSGIFPPKARFNGESEKLVTQYSKTFGRRFQSAYYTDINLSQSPPASPERLAMAGRREIS